MRWFLARFALALAIPLGLLPGCRHCCRRPACTAVTPAPAVPAPGALFIPSAPPAPPSATFEPSPSPAPPGAVPFNPQPAPSGSSPLPSAPEPPAWQPSPQVDVRLGPPQSSAPEQHAGEAPASGFSLRPPEVTEQITPAPQKPQPRPNPPGPKTPTVAVPPASPPAPALPVGIPQFAEAKPGVAAGLRPMLDGLDWLQSNGYRTVVRIRAAGEDDATDRKQVEKRGLRYVVLEVSPESLTQQTLADFTRLVTDPAGRPAFVYDRDGALAGPLWYLHFRTADGLGDEAARVRAGTLGLREDRDGAHREMWQAARRLLAQATK